MAGEEQGASRSAIKAAFERARQAQNIDLVLPALRTAQLYVIVRPDPVDPTKQALYLVPSPKGRPSATVSESLETLQKVPWPKRGITGRQLLDELQPGQEIVIAYRTAATTSPVSSWSGSSNCRECRQFVMPRALGGAAQLES